MIKFANERPVHIAIQVSLTVKVWMSCDGNQMPSNQPDFTEDISLGRTLPANEKLDNALDLVMQIDDMTTRCADAIEARLFDKL